MGSFFLMVFALAIAAVLSVWEGWVLTKLWAWFMVPFFGLPALTICLVAAFLTHQRMRAKHPDPVEDLVDSIGHSIASGLILLLMGWCVVQFM